MSDCVWLPGDDVDMRRRLGWLDTGMTTQATSPVRVTAAVQGEVTTGGEVATETRDEETAHTEDQDLPPGQLQSKVTVSRGWLHLEIKQVLDDVIVATILLCWLIHVRFSADKGSQIKLDGGLNGRQALKEFGFIQTVFIQ